MLFLLSLCFFPVCVEGGAVVAHLRVLLFLLQQLLVQLFHGVVAHEDREEELALDLAHAQGHLDREHRPVCVCSACDRSAGRSVNRGKEGKEALPLTTAHGICLHRLSLLGLLVAVDPLQRGPHGQRICGGWGEHAESSGGRKFYPRRENTTKGKKEKGRETRSGQELRDVLPHDLVRFFHEHVLCRIVDQLHHSLDTQHKARVGGGGQHAVRKINNR